MKEKDIQRLFGIQNNTPGVFELKLAKGPSIRWDAVKDHQIKALELAAGAGLYYKISDARSVFRDGEKQTAFTSRKPFDCFFVKNFPAYVVICWYVPRALKRCHYIHIRDFLCHKLLSKKKSFMEHECFEMSCRILDLKG